MENNYNDILIEYSKNINKNIKNIKNCIKNHSDKITKKTYLVIYDGILEDFKNNDENTLYKISVLKNILDYLNLDKIIFLIEEINNKINYFKNDKIMFSQLKSLLIKCKKKIVHKNNFKKVNEKIVLTNDEKIQKTIEDIQTCDNYQKKMLLMAKLSIYIDRKKIEVENKTECETTISYTELIKKFHDINNKNEILEPLLKLINKCKRLGNITNNELESILLECDKNLYEHVYFLNDLYEDKDKTIEFLSKLGFEKKDFPEIDVLNLKRGFIKGLTRDNKDYILKYQPNKSVMELIINSYLRPLPTNNFFLIPLLFFINNDNSYFYIIEKFNSDLYKYFNLLDEKKKILTFKEILQIIKFIFNSIEALHDNNIVHCDYKLENIVLNIDNNCVIKDLKIIDFDVGLFNSVPEKLKKTTNIYQKILNNKKPRGTRIYMLKNKEMTFQNDIFSLGVISIVLLYKNTKLLISFLKNIESKLIIKKLTEFRNKIEDNNMKIKLVNIIEKYLVKEHTKFIKNNKTKTKNKALNKIKELNINNDIYEFFDETYNIELFSVFKDFINDCLGITKKYDIKSLIEKYQNTLFINL